MASSTDHNYALGRNSLASFRLELQHYVLLDLYKEHLHSFIPVGGDLRIADLATGTGIWAIEVAKKWPGARVSGFDISLSQVPPKEWLPRNVEMHTLDLMGEMPQQWVEAFDIVHIRHVVLVSPNRDRLVANVLKMLKPGGYVQWTEAEHSSMRIFRVRPELQVTALEGLMNLFRRIFPPAMQRATMAKWTAGLRGELESQGVEVLAEDRRKSRPEMRCDAASLLFFTAEELARGLPDQNAAKEAREALEKAVKEFEDQGRGVAVTAEYITLVAMKPMIPTTSLGLKDIE